MLRPRFRAVELSYGRHERRWDLPPEDRPIVITGPNGSGKTTLLEGLVRTLFGYDRRRSNDAARLHARRPWSGEPTRGSVWLVRDDEEYRIERDFATGHVRITTAEGDETFDGDGNPGGRNQEARHHRRILTDLLGLPELEGYQKTLFIEQGALPESGLGEHLLRVAAGGHARVDAARREIAQAHREITRRPIHSTAHPAVNPRELEKLDEEVTLLERRLQEAREAGERRGPLALERDRTADRLQMLEREIRLLEDAHGDLARTDSVELEARQLRDLTRKLDRAADTVGAAVEEAQAAEAAREDALRGGEYPADFPERLARAELRWRDIAHVDPRASIVIGSIAAVLAITAAVLAALAQPELAVQITATAAGLGLAATVALWIERRRRERSARKELRDALAGVPSASELSPSTRDRALARFRAQQDTTSRVEEARERLADALRDARGLLRDARLAGLSLDASLAEDPEAAVREAAERARERLVRGRMELERVGDASLELPDGVVPTQDGVREALRERRDERNRVQQTLQGINQELLERGTPAESIDAVEASLSALLPRREGLDRKARVLEEAHSLISDAYDAFRDHDQERLVHMVSERAEALTGGEIGPVEVPDVLEEARVRCDGRLLELNSPPLSFGEFHSLLLAVRLGAADFLAGVGIAPPLIIDEPFAHLDRARARSLWQLLTAVARGRQVIITTQDELLLQDLDVEPDIQLG